MSTRLIRIAIIGGFLFLATAIVGTITLGGDAAPATAARRTTARSASAPGPIVATAASGEIATAAPEPIAATAAPSFAAQATQAVSSMSSRVVRSVGSMDEETIGSTILTTLLLGASIPLALLLLGSRKRDQLRRNGGVRVQPAKVRYMAARGVAYPEIARRTGLSQDAIALLLKDPRLPAAAGRKIRPSTARVA